MKIQIIKILTCCFLLCPLTAFTQGNQNVFFLKNSGKSVSTRDSADFIRIISLPDSGSKLFNIKEYYANGKIKSIGKTSDSEKSLLEGACVSFFPSGKRSQLANYIKGHLSGNVYDYYPNGTLYRQKLYPTNSSAIYPTPFTVVICQDSTGKTMVTDSSGYYVDYSPDFIRIYEEGNLKNGKKIGEWKGIAEEKDSLASFIEKYSNGKLLTGISTDLKGKIYIYDKREIQPEFVGKERAFGRFLQEHIRYPAVAKRKNITGRVFIQFMVEVDGTLTNFEILRDPGSGLGDESLRVLKLSPTWTHGLMYGKPERFQFTVPINFSLAE